MRIKPFRAMPIPITRHMNAPNGCYVPFEHGPNSGFLAGSFPMTLVKASPRDVYRFRDTARPQFVLHGRSGLAEKSSIRASKDERTRRSPTSWVQKKACQYAP